LLQQLRETLSYPVVYSLLPTRVSRQFQIAEDSGCRFAVIIDELFKRRDVGVKDLKSRVQTICRVEDLVGELQNEELWRNRAEVARQQHPA
jgi:histidyl-tRNA synthetase